MASQKEVVVVIPVYKEKMTGPEQVSLNRCMELLQHHPICLIAPENLSLHEYPKGANIFAKRYSSSFFSDIQGYNRLLLSPCFYEDFADFSYMLIYQLDCYLFSDKISDWCGKDYDYIGAPWVKQNIFRKWFSIEGLYPKSLVRIHSALFSGRFLSRVGNGGLSLRKTSSMISNLKRFRGAATAWRANEDSFFCHYVKTFNPFFRLPSFREAAAFSFDAHPDLVYNINERQLPFGCHAWYRNDPPHYGNNHTFWAKFIALPTDNNPDGNKNKKYV